MRLKVKRIIAREGLIIIALLFLSSIFFFVDFRISKHKSLYEANVQRIMLDTAVGETTAERFLDSPVIILRFPKNTNNDIIRQTIKRDFPNIKINGGVRWLIWDIPGGPEGENINASYDEKGMQVFNSIIYKIRWPYVALFFLIFAYPLYLVIRFVIWAIATLKEKKNSMCNKSNPTDL